MSPTSAAGNHSLTREQGDSWTIQALREDFLRQPARVQTETLDRVLRLLSDELRRKQAQPSALARLARKVYGIRAQDLFS